MRRGTFPSCPCACLMSCPEGSYVSAGMSTLQNTSNPLSSSGCGLAALRKRSPSRRQVRAGLLRRHVGGVPGGPVLVLA